MKISCGIIPFKIENGEPKYFLGHTGGNWDNKGFWMFLKGGKEGDESDAQAALREFKEETGLSLDDVTIEQLIPLGRVQQNPQKTVVAFALEYPDINPARCKSNLADDGYTLEIDNFKWMNLDEVCKRTHRAHLIFYDTLDKMLRENGYCD